jgi:hypothetical protein
MAKEIIATSGHSILVDDSDFEELNRYKWTVNITGHAARKIRVEASTYKRIWIGMHRQIMGLPAGTRGKDGHIEVDHINGDRLDNRRSNLRACTRQQNVLNRRGSSRTGFKGVTQQAKTGLFCAEIRVGAIRKHLGSYQTAEEAHEVYCLWADMLHGEFANHEHNQQANARAHNVIEKVMREPRVSLSDANQIRDLRGTLTVHEVAKRFGIAASYVYAIWSGRSRKDTGVKA